MPVDPLTTSLGPGQRLELQGTRNTRDIGGYRTVDSATVRRGVVFRSDGLDHLTDADTDLLLGAGANINSKGAQGQTALHAAAQWGYDKVAEHLIAKGADVNAKDQRGYTPLDAARGEAGGSGGFDGSRKDVHETTTALLLKHGAQPGTPAAPRRLAQ